MQMGLGYGAFLFGNYPGCGYPGGGAGASFGNPYFDCDSVDEDEDDDEGGSPVFRDTGLFGSTGLTGDERYSPGADYMHEHLRECMGSDWDGSDCSF